METFAFTLKNLPNLDSHRLRSICTSLASTAIQRKFDPVEDSLYLQFSNEHDYLHSMASVKEALKDKDDITLHDNYEVKFNLEISTLNATLTTLDYYEKIMQAQSGNRIMLISTESIIFCDDRTTMDYLQFIKDYDGKLVTFHSHNSTFEFTFQEEGEVESRVFMYCNDLTKLRRLIRESGAHVDDIHRQYIY